MAVLCKLGKSSIGEVDRSKADRGYDIQFNGKLEEQRRDTRASTPPGSAGLSPSRPNTPGSSQRESSSSLPSANRPSAKRKPSLPSLVGKGYQFGGPSSASHSTSSGFGAQQPNIDNILSPFSEQPSSATAGLFGANQNADLGFSNTFSMGKDNQNTPRASSGVSHAAHSDDEEEVEDPRDVPLSNNPTSPTSGIPKGYNLGRRTSVSAESLDPSQTQPMPKTVIPKTPSQRQRIEQSIKNNLLFRNLDEDQYNDVLNAMKEVRVPAGTQVIVQGAVGDFFYVVESGTFEVWVKPPATHSYDPVTRQSTATSSGEAKMVAKIESGGSFGELALMYNAPRAATVVGVAASSTLWALDRVTFRSILMEHTSRKRKMYEVFLSEVGILVSLEPHERAKIADALEEKVYEEGEPVVIEGEVGKNFYIIESGQAEVTKRRGGRGEEERVSMLSRGDYFGGQ